MKTWTKYTLFALALALLVPGAARAVSSDAAGDCDCPCCPLKGKK